MDRELGKYSSIINVGNIQLGKNSMSANMTFVIAQQSHCQSDDEFSTLQEQLFTKIESKRIKKYNNKIIQLIDLPFGLWQCRLCGFVNNIKNWPSCKECKAFF